MGNSSESVDSQLVFVQSLQDKHFGEVEIYRSQAGLFIMKVIRTVISGDKRHLEQLHIMDEISGMTSIIPIIHLNKIEEKSICIKYERLEIYTEYYNFTLADLMATKRELDQAELWFLFSWLLELVYDLQSKKIHANLTLDTIFLTPAGTPCLYHYHLYSCRDSISYSELTSCQSIAKIILQLALGIQLKELTQAELLQSQQLFSQVILKYKILGNFIKTLIVEQSNPVIIRQEIARLKDEDLIRIASEVKLLKFKYHLPENPHFLNLPTTTLSKTPSSASAKNNNKENMGHPLSKSINKKQRNNHGISQQDLSNKILQTQESNTKQRKILETSSVFNNSSTKKQCPTPPPPPPLTKQEILKNKEESAKMLSELDRKKEEYRLQREKFQMRKEELMRGGKQNQRTSQSRKSQRKIQPQMRKNQGRKVTQHNRNGKYR